MRKAVANFRLSTYNDQPALAKLRVSNVNGWFDTFVRCRLRKPRQSSFDQQAQTKQQEMAYISDRNQHCYSFHSSRLTMSSGKRLGSGFQPTTPYSNAPYDPLHDNDGTGYLNPTFSGSTQPHPEQGYTSPFGHHAGPSSSPILPRLGSAGSQVRPRPLGQHSFSSPVPATRSSPGASTGIHGGPSRNSAHVSEPQVESLIDKLRKSQANLWQQFSDAGDLQAQRNDHYEGRIKELMDSVARLTDPTTGAVTSNDLASQ